MEEKPTSQNMSPNYPIPNNYQQQQQQPQQFYQPMQQQNPYNNQSPMYMNQNSNPYYGQQQQHQQMYGGGQNFDPMGQNYYQGGPNPNSNMNSNFPNHVIYVKDPRQNSNQNQYKDPEVWDPPSPKVKPMPKKKPVRHRKKEINDN